MILVLGYFLLAISIIIWLVRLILDYYDRGVVLYKWKSKLKSSIDLGSVENLTAFDGGEAEEVLLRVRSCLTQVELYSSFEDCLFLRGRPHTYLEMEHFWYPLR